MGYSPTTANQMLDSLTGGAINVIAYVTTHTADPGTTGASEYPSVTRLACAWSAASGRARTNTTSLSLATSGATAVPYLGAWSALTTGTFGVGILLSSPVTATTITVAPGALTINA